MTTTYIINCVIAGENREFLIEIESSKTVDFLREKIKEKRKNTFANIDAAHLDLYRVNISGSRNEKIEQLKKMAGDLDWEELIINPSDELTEIYSTAPPEKGTIHIIVQPPQTASLGSKRKQPEPGTTTPPNHPSGFPNLNTTPEKTESPGSHTVKDLIDKYLDDLRPMIREFLSNPTLPNWMPPESVDNETRNFYNDISIPLFNKKPSLLLHQLGNTSNPNVHDLFQDNMDVRILRILCNTSGSGKTRLLFEGLCQYWGFYFVAAQGTDGIGARDLEGMLARMSTTPGWIRDIFTGRNSQQVLMEVEANEGIASNRISKVLLARWTVFQLFIEVAKELDGGFLYDDIRRRWLLFQILPNVRIGDKDPFLALIHTCLLGVANDVLDTLRTPLTPKNILGPAFDPSLNYFFYVLDEAQVAGKQYMGAFTDANGEVRRPVLRPLVRNLASSELHGVIRTIVSGTGFSLDLFKQVVTSGVGKDTTAWDSVHSTGDFSDQDAQLAYISRYVPSPFLISPSGEILKTRMYEWLRGRHRFTVRYLEELMRGHWEANSPASPHRLLNAYVHQLADFKPIDADPTLLEQEAEVKLVGIDTFQWEKIEREPRMLDELSHSLYSYMTRGEYPMWKAEWETIVEYGLGRFITEKTAIVDEPLALVGVLHYFETTGRTVSSKIRGGMQENKGKAFEELLLVAITKLLRDPRLLTDCVQFHHPIPEWATCTAQIVARNSSGGFEPFDTIDDRPSVASHGIAFHAEGPGDVKRWLETGEAGWCIPGTSMGPDLMTRLQLSNGTVLLLVVQAKCFFSGNQHTVTARTTAKAIRSLIPANFFASLIRPKMKNTTETKKRKTINQMLTAIDKDEATGLYHILRVVGALPLTADFNSKSAEVKDALREDSHALAQLTRPALTSALATTSGDRSILSMLTVALKRTRGEVDDEAEDDEPNRKSQRK